MGLPTSTSAPAGTKVASRVPSASAGTSTSALSVSTTMSESPFPNDAPAATGQDDRTADVEPAATSGMGSSSAMVPP